MKKRIRLKKRLKLRYKILIATIIIITIIVVLFVKIINNLTPKLLTAANIKLDNITNSVIQNSIVFSETDIKLIDKIISIELNANGEISGASFNYANIYRLTDSIATKFTENFNKAEIGEYNGNSFVERDRISGENYTFSLPLGIVFSNPLFASFGPKIPVTINFEGTSLTRIVTKITDYGINNSLMEVSLVIEVRRQMITPVVKDNSLITYELPISSRIIQGNIPLMYAGGINTQSENLNIPIAG